MAIKDILLPLVGEPSAMAIAAIDKCVAVAGDIGARVQAMAVDGRYSPVRRLRFRTIWIIRRRSKPCEVYRMRRAC